MAPTSVTAFGWELHHSGMGHDKFYRIIVIDTVVIFNWGARGGSGQFQTHILPTSEAAQKKAATQTNAKSDKGYVVTRDMTSFTVPRLLLDRLVSAFSGIKDGKLNNPAPDATSRITELFKSAAAAQGTASSEASR